MKRESPADSAKTAHLGRAPRLPHLHHNPGVRHSGGMRTFCPATAGEGCSELLILADGTVLAQNLTETVAEILTHVAPHDSSLQRRAGRGGSPKSFQS